MGQKISDLKSVLGSMEDRGLNEIRISVESLGLCLDREDNNGNEVRPFNVKNNVSSGASSSGAASRDHSVSRTSEENGNNALTEPIEPSTSAGASGSNKKRSKRKKKKSPRWVLRFNCARLKSGSGSSGAGSEPDSADSNFGLESCICTGYCHTDEHHLGARVVFERRPQLVDGSSESEEEIIHGPLWEALDLKFNHQDEYSIDDCDERARIERAREIAEGVDPPPGYQPGQHIQLLCVQDMNLDSLTALLHSALSQLDTRRVIHTQVDYIHCLVPDLHQITSSPYYWGKMDRYEAERLLEGKPDGTFVLRDSAQEEFLFSVSFQKYDRCLHARIEQWKHLFSFDSHDPGVYSSPTVCGLIEHYKDSSCCMYFEPTLTIPLRRNFAFPLQHLARSVICSNISYDGISQLRLPKSLKAYLREYHYKQRVKFKSCLVSSHS